MDLYQIFIGNSTVGLEVVGYVGSALVIVSMLMVNVVKLRAFNALGSLISASYAFVKPAIPVLILNGALFVINIVQLVRLFKASKEYSFLESDTQSPVFCYLYGLHKADALKRNPNFEKDIKSANKVFMIYDNDQVAGVFVAKISDGQMSVIMDDFTNKIDIKAFVKSLDDFMKQNNIKEANFDALSHEAQDEIIKAQSKISK